MPLRRKTRSILLEAIEPRVLRAGDNVDTTFGVNGYSIVTSANLAFRDVELQSDDKIVTAATFTTPNGKAQFAAVRWTANGALDTTFSSDGIATADLFPAGDNHDGSDAARVAIQSDGKILVAGTVFDTTTVSGVVSFSFQLGLARFNTNGTLDTSFSADGMSTLSLDTESAQVLQVDTLSTGKIEVFGMYQPQQGVSNMLFARFNADGTPDTTFGGGDGWTSIPNLVGEDAVDEEILPDGKVVVISGGGSNGLHVYRFNGDGTLDTTFASDGRTEFFASQSFSPNDLAIDPDGKIVISGSVVLSNTPFGALTRLNADGTLDTTLANNFTSGRKGVFDDISLAPNGDINLGGGFIASLVYKYTAEGAPVSGYATGVIAGDQDHMQFNTIVTQSTGKVILAGNWFPDPTKSGTQLAIARLSDTPAPFDDGSQGAITLLGTSGADTLTVSTSGSTITVVLNNVTTTYSAVSYSALNFQALGGDDHVTITSPLNVGVDLGDGDDTITTASGSDSITGGAGADSINVGDGRNSVQGGDGNDTIIAGSERDTLKGDAGADSISAGDGSDSVSGGAGDDHIDGQAGDDFLFGDDGNDVLFGSDGNDRLFGLNGFDSLYGGAQKDQLSGGANGDLLSGGGGKDKLAGEGSRDRIYGGAGDDHIDGGAGNDYILAGAGNDNIIAGLGSNFIDGGDGDDFAVGDREVDQIMNTESGT